MTATKADAIIHARTVRTLAPSTEGVTAIGITGGRITHLGSPADASAWAGPGTAVHDFGDACVVPGLIDSHIHPVMGAEITCGVDLTDAGSLAEAAALLASEAERTPAPAWVRGWGLKPTLFGAGNPDNGFLGGLPADRPALVRLFDAHSAVVNGAALAAAGIHGAADFAGVPGIERGPHGLPTGWLVEMDAMDLALDAMPLEPLAERAARLHDVLTQFARHGITGGQVMDFGGDSAALLAAVEDGPGLPLELRCAAWCVPGTTEEDWANLASLVGTGGRRWAVTGIKFFIDGTIDNGTAWLHEPDANGESRDPFWPDATRFSEALRYFADRSIPTATHAIGDAAIAHVLRTLAQVPEAARSIHRIEHLETLPDALIQEMARIGVAASMQPTHCTHFVHADRSDNWSSRLGEDRADRGWRCRDLREAGVTVALGSDWPIAPYDPRAIMADAQLRHRVDRPGAQPINPEQGLTALMALEGYTTHAAKAAGLPDHGSIALGNRANLTVLAADPLASSPAELAATAVLATFVDGALEHSLVGC
ncbi:amidohydrolase [Arthrobacter ginkgonis]|uniref:Amidohydrolase n=1 Tax=Arthrobacter ginkgonis TaxID=1630594 RepID=A0ABP7C5R8_9MICC